MKNPFVMQIHAACIALALTGALPARAEVSELNLAQQYGVSFIPLMWMESNKLVEKHAKAAGLGNLKVSWIKLAGPAAMNDALLSGSLHFASAGCARPGHALGTDQGQHGRAGASRHSRLSRSISTYATPTSSRCVT
jgi:NitT/TauT family transport system substrate-binding protein